MSRDNNNQKITSFEKNIPNYSKIPYKDFKQPIKK